MNERVVAIRTRTYGREGGCYPRGSGTVEQTAVVGVRRATLPVRLGARRRVVVLLEICKAQEPLRSRASQKKGAVPASRSRGRTFGSGKGVLSRTETTMTMTWQCHSDRPLGSKARGVKIQFLCLAATPPWWGLQKRGTNAMGILHLMRGFEAQQENSAVTT